MNEYEKEQKQWQKWNNYQRLDDCFKWHQMLFNAQITKIFEKIGYIVTFSDGIISFYDGVAQCLEAPALEFVKPNYSFNSNLYECPSKYPDEIKLNLINLIKYSEKKDFVKAINYSIADLFCDIVIAEVAKRTGSKCKRKIDTI